MVAAASCHQPPPPTASKLLMAGMNNQAWGIVGRTGHIVYINGIPIRDISSMGGKSIHTLPSFHSHNQAQESLSGKVFTWHSFSPRLPRLRRAGTPTGIYLGEKNLFIFPPPSQDIPSGISSHHVRMLTNISSLLPIGS